MKLCDDNNIEWIVECEHGLKVLYVNDLSEVKNENNDFKNYFKNICNHHIDELDEKFAQGYVKTKDYSAEKEYRIRIAMRPNGSSYKSEKIHLKPIRPNFKYVYIDIKKMFDEKNIEAIITPEFLNKQKFYQFCKKNNLRYRCKKIKDI